MSRSLLITASVAVAALVTITAFAEPEPFATPIQGHGGNGKGAMRPSDDRTLTEITRVELGYANLVTSLNAARTALTQASWTNRAQVGALAAKLAEAELALALKKAEAFQALKTKLGYTTPEQIQRLKSGMGAGGGAGGRGGGRAAAAPAAAAPGAAAAPAPAARGN